MLVVDLMSGIIRMRRNDMLARATRSSTGGIDFDEARQQWDGRGYAIVEGAIHQETCKSLALAILSEYDRVAKDGLSNLGGALSGHLNCFPGSESRTLVEAVERAGVTEFISEMFGEPLTLKSVGCNCNLPRSHYQHFHADSYWNNPFMIVNIMLVDTTLENGATELIPGSDKKPLPYWKFVASRLARLGVRHPMKSGDILIRSSRLWHRGTPNRSDRMRPMIALIYSPANGCDTKVNYNQNGGKVTFKYNMFTDNWRGRVREFSYVYFPMAIAAYMSVMSVFRKP